MQKLRALQGKCGAMQRHLEWKRSAEVGRIVLKTLPFLCVQHTYKTQQNKLRCVLGGYSNYMWLTTCFKLASILIHDGSHSPIVAIG